MKSIWKAGCTVVLLFSIFQLGCGDTYRSILTPIPQPSGNPAFFDTIAVIQQGDPTLSGVLTQINVSGDTNMGEKPIGAGAVMGAVDSSFTNIFTPNRLTANITANSVSSFTRTTISLPDNFVPVYVTGTKSGTVYVANSGASGSVGVINSASLVFTQEIPIPAGPTNFLVQTSDTTKLFALSTAAGKVSIIDTNSATVENTVSVGSQPVYAVMSLDQQFVYVLNSGSNDISVLRVADDTVLPGTISTGHGANFMALDKRLNRLYVTNTGDNTISAFDVTVSSAPKLIGGPVPVGPAPVQLTALTDGSRVYVLNSDATITELLASNLTTVKTINASAANATGAAGTSITSSHDASRVYAGTVDSANLTNSVAIISTVDDAVSVRIKSPQVDSACDPTKTSCELMKPVFLFTRAN